MNRFGWDWIGKGKIQIAITDSSNGEPIAIVNSTYWANKICRVLNSSDPSRIKEAEEELDKSQEKVIDLQDKLEIYENLAT